VTLHAYCTKGSFTITPFEINYDDDKDDDLFIVIVFLIVGVEVVVAAAAVVAVVPLQVSTVPFGVCTSRPVPFPLLEESLQYPQNCPLWSLYTWPSASTIAGSISELQCQGAVQHYLAQ
jgi:hypothetical protein